MDQIEKICRWRNKSDLKINFVLGLLKRIMGKEKMLVTSVFSYCDNVFKKASFSESGLCGIGLKLGIVWEKMMG